MSQVIDRIMKDLQSLTSSEKSFVVQCIISALDEYHDSDALSQWEEVAKKRYDEIQSGEVKAIGWEEIKAQVVGR